MPKKKQNTKATKKTKQVAPKPEVSPHWQCEEHVEGQLSVDVFQKGNNLIVMSTIAGVKPQDVEVSIDHDMLTIRGKRQHGIELKDSDYFYKECYWGGFSRSIILPAEVNVDQVKADIKNGVLTVSLPLAEKRKKIEVKHKNK